jgi:hypothetical protein
MGLNLPNQEVQPSFLVLGLIGSKSPICCNSILSLRDYSDENDDSFASSSCDTSCLDVLVVACVHAPFWL